MEYAIKFENVSKTYATDRGEITALREFSMQVKPGTLLWLRGNSGGGKSTVIRLAGLLTDPTRGIIQLLGQTHKSTSDSSRRMRETSVGMVFQSNNLLSELTVLQNLLISRDGILRDEAMNLLASMGLAEVAETKAKALSGGEAQRAAIARAVIGKPQILLADEPTSGLDTANADAIRATFRSLAENGTTVLLASHDEATRTIASDTITISQEQK